MDKSNPKRILLIDDDPDLQVGAAARLCAAGYEARIANDGNEGLDAAIQCDPDAILMDIRMPECDGLEALRALKLRDDTKDIPVIMLSASVSLRQTSLDQGAKYFIPKPYDGRALLAAVASATSDPSAAPEHVAVSTH